MIPPASAPRSPALLPPFFLTAKPGMTSVVVEDEIILPQPQFAPDPMMTTAVKRVLFDDGGDQVDYEIGEVVEEKPSAKKKPADVLPDVAPVGQFFVPATPLMHHA